MVETEFPITKHRAEEIARKDVQLRIESHITDAKSLRRILSDAGYDEAVKSQDAKIVLWEKMLAVVEMEGQ